jgi:hypothetical protein
MIKAATNRFSTVSETIRDTNGDVVKDMEAKVDRWKEHFSMLLNRPLPQNPIPLTAATVDPAASVSTLVPSEDEVLKAIRALKSSKAPGEDGLPPEFYKHGGPPVLADMTKIVRTVWELERIPENWRLAELIPLFKKGDKTNCKNYRGISLIDIASKIFESVLVSRLKTWRESMTRENQAGFRPGRSCTDQIFTLRQLIESRHEFNHSTFIVFIDFSAAFDSVHRPSLWQIMREDGCPEKIVRLFECLYQQTLCRVRVYNQQSQPFEIKTGVRQGAISSPMLFNWCIDWVMKTALNDTDGILIGNGNRVADLAFADDIALLGASPNDLQDLLHRITVAAARIGLSINAGKTKAMCCNTNVVPQFRIGADLLENVDSFTYLGSTIAANGDGTCEVQNRIAKAQAAMSMLKSLWNNRRVSNSLKKRVYLASVRPVLLYGCDTWPLRSDHEKKLDAFEHKAWRWILHVSYRDRVRNTTIRDQIGIHDTATTIVKQRRLIWLGHVLRMSPNRLSKQTLLSPVPIDWKRPFRAVRKTWRRKVFEDLNVLSVHRIVRRNVTYFKNHWLDEIHNLAQDRDVYAKMIFNLHAA